MNYPFPKHPLVSFGVSPRIIEKGWGKETILVNNEEYCGKILSFNKGTQFSMHMHVKKRETFYVVKGRLKVETILTEWAIKEAFEICAGQVINIPRLAFHQLTALEESEIIEISTHHDDLDSYRVLPGDSQNGTRSK